MHSPPLTPIRDYVSSQQNETSPTCSYREQLRRRNSSFSSNHDRSPITPRSKHRFSNASNYSGNLPTPADDFGNADGGMGNLADELDQLDDEDDEEFEAEAAEYNAGIEEEKEAQEAARDSGIDVSYSDKRTSQKPNRRSGIQSQKPPDEPREETLSPELEDAMDDIARLSRQMDGNDDPAIPRLIPLLQNLGNQAVIETGTQRLNTSTNSMSAHLLKETKALQMLSASLLSPFGFSAVLDVEALEESIPFIEDLLKELPVPDPAALHGVQRLSHDTQSVAQTLSSLVDTLQMGKQATNTTARHLRTTQTMVMELRREQERADLARFELSKSDVESKIRERWSARQCKDVVSGFDEVCEGLRRSLAEAVEAAA